MLLPEGYQIKHVPRVKRPGGYHGGGVALIHKSSIDVSLLESTNYNEFNTLEYMDCNIKIKNYSLRLVVVYRPPPSKENGLKTSEFLNDDWPKFLAKYTVTDKNIIITGDLNFHLDNVTNHDTVKFTSVLQSCGMLQHVKGPTRSM